MTTAKRISAACTFALVATLAGCDAPARRVETGGPETIRTIGQIDDQDWAEAATKLTNNMLTRDDLLAPKPDGTKRILAISRIINNTSEVVDTDLLVKRIRVTLSQAGKTLTMSTDDTAAREAGISAMNGNRPPIQPDYRLSGKLIETQAQAGDIRQATFYFQLSLTDANGLDAWEGQQQITKLGSHNSVGL